MKARIIYLNGNFVKANDALIKSLTPGIVQGQGAFETMRVFQGEPLFFEDHWHRLQKGLKVLGIRMSQTLRKVEEAIVCLLDLNALCHARLRLSVWKEKGKINIAIVVQPLQLPSNKDYRKGYRAVVSEIIKNRTRTSHIKSIDYYWFYQAFLEAQAKGYNEAILLNKNDFVIEGARTNIFCFKKKVLYTPATRCGCLNGIARQNVLRLARREGIDCRVIEMQLSQLFEADEAFVTNAVLGVMPLTSIQRTAIGKGFMGSQTEVLKNAYFEFI